MTDWEEITDPEELFRLKREGWEIQINGFSGWEKWEGTTCIFNMRYRARPCTKTKTKKVKLLCWFDGEDLFWKPEDHPVMHWRRFPAGDIEGEVEE